MRTLVTLLFVLISFNFLFAQKVLTGYVPIFRTDSLKEANYDNISHALLAFGNPNKNGDLSFDFPIDSIVGLLKTKNKKVLASLGGGGSYSFGPEFKIYLDLLGDKKRKSFIKKIIKYALKNNLDGFDLNLEGYALSVPGYERFTLELAKKCKKNNLILMGTYFSRDSRWVSDSVLNALDYVQIMSYGGVGIQNRHNPKNLNSVYYFQKNWDHWIRRVNSKKLIMGIALYAPLFPMKDAEFDIENAFTSYKFLEKQMGVNLLKTTQESITIPNRGFAFFNNKEQLDQIAKISNACAGYMFWEVSQDAQTNSIIRYFDEHLIK